jgi:inorganic pyrophosphatase
MLDEKREVTMSNDPYRSIATWSHAHDRVHVVVDTPMGSRNKYKFDPELKIFKLSHVLPPGASFPYDFGSIPQTAAPDGDPLDILVIAHQPSFAGCLLDVKLIGVIEAHQTVDGKTLRNDRLLGVPVTSVNPPMLQELADLGAECLSHIELFFVSYNHAHGRSFKPLHRRGTSAARALVLEACTRYRLQDASRAGSDPQGR